MSKVHKVRAANLRFARRVWSPLPQHLMQSLNVLSDRYSFYAPSGDLLLLDGKWYVTHAGLLNLAQRRRCHGIKTFLEKGFCDPARGRWVFKAVVYKSPYSKGFVGYGDADPSNTSPLVRGAEMRIAETRAVNRALRKAYGIGLCSVEELGYLSSRTEPGAGTAPVQSHPNGNGSSTGNGHTRLRDRLCLLIRQYQLDPTLVKRYAADFCGTQELREASRELVESFITHLSESAAKDHAGLVCKLNSYAQPQEAHQ